MNSFCARLFLCAFASVLMKMRENAASFSLCHLSLSVTMLSITLCKWISLCALLHAHCSTLSTLCKHSWSLFMLLMNTQSISDAQRHTHTLTQREHISTLYLFDYQCGNWGIPFSLSMQCRTIRPVPFPIIIIVILSGPAHSGPLAVHAKFNSDAIACYDLALHASERNRLKSSFHILMLQNTDKWHGLHERCGTEIIFK